MPTIGEKLTELRKAAGMTQDALAEASGVPLSTLRKYEQGNRTKVPFTAVAALARALGTDCTAFAACDDVPEAELPKKKGKK